MDLASLRAQQIELASSVIREDRLDKDPPDLIAGADVGFEQGGEVTRAAMVLLKYPSLELVEYKVARIPAVLASPAILAYWWMCRPLAWRKNGSAVNSNRSPANRARWPH